MVASKPEDIPEVQKSYNIKSKGCRCKGCTTARKEAREEVINILKDFIEELSNGNA